MGSPITFRRVCVAISLTCVHALAALAADPQASPFRFADATVGSGLDYRNVCGQAPDAKGWLAEGMGAGAAWLDYDGDGKLDLYLVNGSTYERAPLQGEPNRLYRGDGKGHFEDVTARSGAGHRGWGFGVTVGDFDNDGHPDLFLTNLGPNALLRNRGDGTFEDVTARAGVGRRSEWSASAAFFDMEGDGDLDLYVGNYMVDDPATVPRRGSKEAVSVNCQYKGVPVFCGPLGRVPLQDELFRNNGDGTFTDVTAAAGLALKVPRYALGVVTGDYDNDGDQDIYVANDSVPNSLWRNAGDGTFVDVGVSALVALNVDGEPQAGMGTDFGDYNGDGLLDLVVTNFSQDVNTIYRNVGGKYFIDDSAAAGLGVTYWVLSWGVGFVDFDQDTDLDLFVANGHIYPQMEGLDLGTTYKQANHLFTNERGRFREVAAASGAVLSTRRSFRGAAFGDYDNDGDMDIVVTALDEAALLLRNDGAPGHFLQVRLVGQASNRDAIGARVRVTAGAATMIRERTGGGSYLSSSDPRLHFGLAGASRVELLEVRWPSGRQQRFEGLAVDRVVTLREGQGLLGAE